MYLVPAGVHSEELVIKKSRFIANGNYAADRASAMHFIDIQRATYPDASHHCWAYLFGPSAAPLSMAMSDDGEPSGTAGKPILNVLQHKEVGNVIVVVTRYFGGTRLGAGGLVRAYSGAAQAVMEHLPTQAFIPTKQQLLVVEFAQEQDLRYWLSQHDGHIIDVEYREQVHCTIKLPVHHIKTLTDATLHKGWVLLQS